MGQSSSTPFMSIRHGHQRRVSFDTKEELGDMIDKLAIMIGKLATRDNRTNSLNHKYIRVEVEFKTGITNTIPEIIRIGTDQIKGQITETEDNTDRTEIGLDMSKILGEVIFRGNIRNYSRGEYRKSHRNYGNNRTRSTSQSRYR